MRLVPVNWQVPVTDAQTKVATIRPKDLQSIIIQVTTGSSPVALGDQGHFTITTGYPMIAGDVLTLTWQDFDDEVRKSSQMIEIWAICAAGLTATLQVFGWGKQ